MVLLCDNFPECLPIYTSKIRPPREEHHLKLQLISTIAQIRIDQNISTSTMSESINTVALHGWTAVPVDPEAILHGKPYIHEPKPILVRDIAFPSSDPLVVRVQRYAQEKLPVQTYNHSMRAFYWGLSPPRHNIGIDS